MNGYFSRNGRATVITRAVTKLTRNQNGSALAEFAPAFMLFVLFGLIPLIACIVIPVRLCMAQGLIDQAAQQLARSEKMSTAVQDFEGETKWENFLSKCGLKIKDKNLSIIVTGKGSQAEFNEPSQLAQDWLPGGGREARTYMLQLSAKVEVPPVLPGYSVSLPGLTSPLKMTVKSERLWENLSCNPETNHYYINE